ncbi:ATP-dependent Clp endopeptidase proteolytic subunit ClpP [Rhodococcus olei]|uniref:ATP-dependent Clp protease proteolytic subunit n=1 Tax=Rhodococcus olei TaxID=2161675 RepID=A0ABP8NVZ5_9NOCA
MTIWPPPQIPPFPPVRTPWRTEPRPSAPAPMSTQVAAAPGPLADRLLDHRIIALTGNLDRDASGRTVAALALLDASGDQPVRLRLTDVAADLDTAFTVLDALDLMRAEIHVTCLGTVAGGALAVLVPARHRIASPHSLFHLCEPDAVCIGVGIEAEAARHRDRMRTLTARIADTCGRPESDVAADMRAHRILTADEARDYGLIDTVTGAHPA